MPLQAARRQLPPAPPHDEQRQVGDVVGVEVGERHVRDTAPVHTKVGHAVHRAAAAVEQQADVIRFHEVRRRHAGGVRRGGAGTDGAKAHAVSVR